MRPCILCFFVVIRNQKFKWWNIRGEHDQENMNKYCARNLRQILNNILRSSGTNVYMTFMIYIKFINEAHLYWLFILSWSALKVIIIVCFHLMLPQTKGYFIRSLLLLSERSLAQEKSCERSATRAGYFLRKGLID